MKFKLIIIFLIILIITCNYVMSEEIITSDESSLEQECKVINGNWTINEDGASYCHIKGLSPIEEIGAKILPKNPKIAVMFMGILIYLILIHLGGMPKIKLPHFK